MDTNVNYTIVGGFVVILVTAIALAIIWLSSGFAVGQYTNYQVFMQESVSGLNIDAPVEFNGVNVGNVLNIDISEQNPRIVNVILKIKKDTPVTQGTTASMNSRGLTGIGFISLLDRGTNLAPLRTIKGQPYPIIRTSPSLFLRWDTALSKLSNSLADTSKAIQSVLDPENQRHIKETIINLNTFTSNLVAQSERLNKIIENTAIASKQFGPMLQAGASAFQSFERQTLPVTNRMLINLNNMSRNLYELSTDLKQNPSILIRGKGTQPLGPGEKQ